MLQKAAPRLSRVISPVALDGGGGKVKKLCKPRLPKIPRRMLPKRKGATASCTWCSFSLLRSPASPGSACSSSRRSLPSSTCSLRSRLVVVLATCIICKSRMVLCTAESGASSNASVSAQSVINAPNFAMRLLGGVSLHPGGFRVTRGKTQKINVFRDFFL